MDENKKTVIKNLAAVIAGGTLAVLSIVIGLNSEKISDAFVRKHYGEVGVLYKNDPDAYKEAVGKE